MVLLGEMKETKVGVSGGQVDRTQMYGQGGLIGRVQAPSWGSAI